ncbi:myosin-51 [Schizosaccharomyces japonicus yFS275]|uniref:Myosin-51 n=1 Tax=Schizosaccharomyces japonicus (strain yFS275 / FY16936) TaxID=402676 RepID=B6JX12_SCHJY|nr:myosin-51 [Schizosaccharomyces japonicus yFS275]EEB05913.2 myosin-51 [Schizosaccharomyces japonicus yFS275]
MENRQKFWVQNKEETWDYCHIVNENVEKGTAEVALEGKDGATITVDRASLFPCNPKDTEDADDLTTLTHLNEPSVLSSICKRYEKQKFYTYSGIVLVALNPYQALPGLYDDSVISQYLKHSKSKSEPHLYSIASKCYRSLVNTSKNQTIIVSGESGAGKTVSAKYIMRFMTSMQPKHKHAPNLVKRSVESQVLATNPIMEAFGNAKTTRNDNSSRFGKYIAIMFNEKNAISGARISTYLLERSRLVTQPSNERNYHIFYQLLAGCSDSQKEAWCLGNVEDFHYLNQGNCVSIENVDDKENFRLTCSALQTIGIDPEQQEEVYQMLVAILHLGNVHIRSNRSEASVDADDASLTLSSKLFGLDSSQLAKWITKRQIRTRSESITTNLTPEQAITVRDSISKFFYSSLFTWLVHMINVSLDYTKAQREAKKYVGVLDIYGFEFFDQNSFEQFCINYANEKLQQEFTKHVFRLEQEEYMSEGLTWNFIEYPDNQACISLIESRYGILSLLDEECRLPSGTHTSWLQKLNNSYSKQPHSTYYKKSRFNDSTFTIKHYAVDVTYTSSEFLSKNMDGIPDQVLELMYESTSPMVRHMVDVAEGASTAKNSTKSTSLSRKPTLGYTFKTSLLKLMETINDTEVYYIRCIKPNETKTAWGLDEKLVLSQLRACGVLETIRISTAGFPTKRTFSEFVKQYKMLLPSSQLAQDEKEICAAIVNKLIDSDSNTFQIGRTKLFFRAGVIAEFEKAREKRLNEAAVLLQSKLLTRVFRKRFLEIRSAVVSLQSAIRGYLKRQEVEKIRRDNAALLLQSKWRMFIQRRWYLQVKDSIVLTQSAIRRFMTMRDYIRQLHERAVSVIVKAWRAHHCHESYQSFKKSVISFQAIIRSRLTRRYLIRLRDSAERAALLKERKQQLTDEVTTIFRKLGLIEKSLSESTMNVKSMLKSLSHWTTFANGQDIPSSTEYRQHVSAHEGGPLADLVQSEVQMKQLLEQLSVACYQTEHVNSEVSQVRNSLETHAKLLESASKQPIVSSLTTDLPSRRHFFLRRAYYTYSRILDSVFQRMKQNSNPNAKIYPVETRDFLTSVLKSHSLKEPFKEQIKQVLCEYPISTLISKFSKQSDKDSQTALLFAGTCNFLIYAAVRLSLSEELDTFFFEFSTAFRSLLVSVGDSSETKEKTNQKKQISRLANWVATIFNIRSLLSYLIKKSMYYSDSKGKEVYKKICFCKTKFELLEVEALQILLQRIRSATKNATAVLLQLQMLEEFKDSSDTSNINKHDRRSVQEFIKTLSGIQKALQSSSLTPEFVNFLFSATIQDIGTSAFRSMLMNASRLTWKRGAQIAFNVTLLKDWCHHHNMGDASIHLMPLLQATSVLSLRKRTESDLKMILSVCCYLTSEQIYVLLCNYSKSNSEPEYTQDFIQAREKLISIDNKGDALTAALKTIGSPNNTLELLPATSNSFIELQPNEVYDTLGLSQLFNSK